MVLTDTRRATAPGGPPASSLRRSDPPRREGFGDAARSRARLALFGAALLLAFGGLGSVLQPTIWWFQLALVTLLPLLTLGVVRAVARRPWQPPVATFLVGVLTLTVGFARDEALLGVIPTPDSVARWAGLVGEGTASIANQRIPAIPDDGILFLLAVLAVLAVVLVAPGLDRAPALAAIPLLVVLDIPVAVRAGIAPPLIYVLVVILFLLLLRVGRRRSPARAVLGVATLAIVGSLFLPNLLPPVRPVAGPAGPSIGTGLNPLIDLGRDLRRDTVVDALTYTSDAGGLYLRLATLDDFTGLSWEPDTSFDPDVAIERFPPPPGLGVDVAREAHSASIAVQDVRGRWLPVPYPATGVEGLEGDWSWEPNGLSVRSFGADARGQDYDVTYLDVEPDRTQLLAPPVASDDEDLARYLDLPQLTPEITAAAAQFEGLPNRYETAIALQAFFRSGDFEYSLDAPVEDGFDGSGVGVITRFLEERSGYCVHYASTMAVLARELGIPARVAVGFQPGERDYVDGTYEYTVTSSDLHAWPELYFDGVGWLRFEPTPGRGDLPSYSNLSAVDDPSTPEDEGATPTTAPTSAPSSGPRPEDEATPTPTAEAAPVVRTQDPTPVVVLVLLGVAALLLLPAAARAGVRWRRMRRVRADGDPVAAWSEIRDTARDHDWNAPDSETPRQLGERLALVVGDEAVAPLRGGVEVAAYARPGPPPMTPEDVAVLRRAIVSAASVRVRLLAFLAPPSLFARLGLAAPRD